MSQFSDECQHTLETVSFGHDAVYDKFLDCGHPAVITLLWDLNQVGYIRAGEGDIRFQFCGFLNK
jgi:hypothetical protein